VKVFATKPMARFIRREKISSSSLIEAIHRAEAGLIDADLGGGLIKQRVARPGQGRSGGYRTIIAFRRSGRAVFLYGFAKNERDNITSDELAELRKVGNNWLMASEGSSIHRTTRREIGGGSPMTRKKKLSPLSVAILEMAEDQHSLGIMDDATYRKITVRHLGKNAHPLAAPITPGEIRALRQRANLSQAALAQLLNLTVGYVSQLERGVKQPKGPSLALLNIVRYKGIETVL
jgi:DNA-binding transcriptional regulator YiaG